jgi:DNA polymerase eta
METIPFTKIRNLGGKLGSEIESDLSIDKASDLWYESLYK